MSDLRAQLRTDSFSPSQWDEYQRLKLAAAGTLPYGTVVDLAKAPALTPTETLKLDLGCGKHKQAGFLGVDSISFPGVDLVVNLGERTRETVSGFADWPWADNSVAEAHCSHFVEHLDAGQRIHFANELYRVLKPGGKATIITPHWNSPRAYGDLTHQWPPLCEWWFLYLSKAWREINAAHNDGYTCDFPQPTIGYSPTPSLNGRNAEYVQQAVTWWRGGADDMQATLVKPEAKP